jgi:SAM-dependent methyltransferase
MSLDVVDLRSFYVSPLGRSAQRFVLRAIRQRWDDLRDFAVLGLGYATPYLDAFRADHPERLIAFMPAQQGIVDWPPDGLSAAALVDALDLPLRDQTFDRILLIHALEMARDPHDLLAELWRILSPGGRLLAVVPNRRGVWARSDNNPFAQGQPYSRRQVTALMRGALFTPIHWGEALYAPPINRRMALRLAASLEAIGGPMSLPFSGVHVIEATKQVYRPVPVRKLARLPVGLEPALSPSRYSIKTL